MRFLLFILSQESAFTQFTTSNASATAIRDTYYNHYEESEYQFGNSNSSTRLNTTRSAVAAANESLINDSNGTWTDDNRGNYSSTDSFLSTLPPLIWSCSIPNQSLINSGEYRLEWIICPFRIIDCIIPTVLSLLTVIGNSMVLLAVSRNRKLSRKLTSILICNLASADLLVGLVVMPLGVSQILSSGYWQFPRIVCRIWISLDVICCTASIVTLCVISIDRFVGVLYPMQYQVLVTRRRLILAAGLIWVFSIAVLLISVRYDRPADAKEREHVCHVGDELEYVTHSVVLSFFGPLAIILFMYYKIYRVTQKREMSLLQNMMYNNNSTNPNASSATNTNANATNTNAEQQQQQQKSSNRRHQNSMKLRGGSSKASRNNNRNNNNNSNNNNRNNSHNSSTSNQQQHGERRKSRLPSLFQGGLNFPGLRIHYGTSGGRAGDGNGNGGANETDADKRRRFYLKHKKSAKTLGIVVGIFLLSWLPFFLLYLASHFCDECIPILALDIFTWLGYSNSAMNPVIYCITVKAFRTEFVYLLTCDPARNSNLAQGGRRCYGGGGQLNGVITADEGANHRFCINNTHANMMELRRNNRCSSHNNRRGGERRSARLDANSTSYKDRSVTANCPDSIHFTTTTLQHRRLSASHNNRRGSVGSTTQTSRWRRSSTKKPTANQSPSSSSAAAPALLFNNNNPPSRGVQQLSSRKRQRRYGSLVASYPVVPKQQQQQQQPTTSKSRRKSSSNLKEQRQKQNNQQLPLLGNNHDDAAINNIVVVTPSLSSSAVRCSSLSIPSTRPRPPLFADDTKATAADATAGKQRMIRRQQQQQPSPRQNTTSPISPTSSPTASPSGTVDDSPSETGSQILPPITAKASTITVYPPAAASESQRLNLLVDEFQVDEKPTTTKRRWTTISNRNPFARTISAMAARRRRRRRNNSINVVVVTEDAADSSSSKKQSSSALQQQQPRKSDPQQLPSLLSNQHRGEREEREPLLIKTSPTAAKQSNYSSCTEKPQSPNTSSSSSSSSSTNDCGDEPRSSVSLMKPPTPPPQQGVKVEKKDQKKVVVVKPSSSWMNLKLYKLLISDRTSQL